MTPKSPVSSLTQIFRVSGGTGRRTSIPEKIETSTTASPSRSFSTTLVSLPQLTLDVSDRFKSTSNIGPLVLSTPPENEAEFDIWFIHGLTGDRFKTWAHANGTYWPSLLAFDFPNARVITYGYDANIARFEKNLQNPSSEGLHSYGQSLAFAIRNSRQGSKAERTRPLYFIAHSLGGLVVEQALLICIGPDESLHDIAESTKGILFMGTPHQGSHLAKWASALGKLIPDNIRTVNQKALKVLKKDSEVCRNLENAFQEQAKNGKLKSVKLFSFYETIALSGLGGMIVPEGSAVLKADGKCPIHGTHMSMVRFDGREDDGYCKVKGQLVAWFSLLEDQVEDDDVAQKEGQVGRRKRREGERGLESIRMVGPTFTGVISKATVNANQIGAGKTVYYYLGNQSEMGDSENGSEDED